MCNSLFSLCFCHQMGKHLIFSEKETVSHDATFYLLLPNAMDYKRQNPNSERSQSGSILLDGSYPPLEWSSSITLCTHYHHHHFHYHQKNQIQPHYLHFCLFVIYYVTSSMVIILPLHEALHIYFLNNFKVS
jgi:hypothetical protein